MAVFTQELNTNYSFPHIDIFNLYSDGVHYGYKALPHEGYVMYDPNANDTEWNEELQEDVPCTYYCRQMGMPLNYNLDNFPMVAVLESEVDENFLTPII